MPLVSRSSAHQDQYVSDLRSAYLGLRLYDPDHAFVQDPLIWDKMLRDPVIRFAVQGRCCSIAGRKRPVRTASGTEEDMAVAESFEEQAATICGSMAATSASARALPVSVPTPSPARAARSRGGPAARLDARMDANDMAAQATVSATV
jgi:hypothetical protein